MKRIVLLLMVGGLLWAEDKPATAPAPVPPPAIKVFTDLQVINFLKARAELAEAKNLVNLKSDNFRLALQELQKTCTFTIDDSGIPSCQKELPPVPTPSTPDTKAK